MKKLLLLAALAVFSSAHLGAQSCSFDEQITTSDSVLCAGDSTTLSFEPVSQLADTVLPTPIVNNNGQDGNMFNITATNTIRITYFEGNIANTPNATTQYYIYYKVGTHVGFESNAAAWTLIAGPVTVTPNAPNTLTPIPIEVNVIIPAGQTYAFYLTNSSAATNNNRYHNGTATGNVSSSNGDLTVYEGTGGAYPFGTFFNARPWEGIVHYDFPPPTYLWNTGDTTSSITVAPGFSTDYSCVASFATFGCTVEDTIGITVNPLPVVDLGNDTAICAPGSVVLDAGNSGALYLWCDGSTTQTINVGTSGQQCVTVVDANGCTSGDTINVTVNNQPFIAAIGDTICPGDTATMFVTGSAFLYTWSPGPLMGNIVTDSPATTTTYTIIGMDGNGCTDTTTAEAFVYTPTAITMSSFGTYCLDDNTIALTGASPAGGFYSGPGVMADSLYPSTAGAGTHMITYTYSDANGCSSSDSAAVTIDLCLGMNDVQTNGVSIYPNPMRQSAMVFIADNVVLHDAQFVLYDVTGKIVMQINGVSSNVITIDRSSLSEGVYFWNFVNDGAVINSGKLAVE